MLQENVVKDIIVWIEQNLDSRLSLDIVAEKSGYTKWHFQRLFKAYTGISLGKYILARRLSCGAYALRVTRCSLLDISLKYRFDSQQTFCRAFKKQFNITPSEYRKKPGWDISELIFPALETVELSAKYEVVTFPSQKLVGMSHHYNKPISTWDSDKKKFRKEFWRKFLKDVHTIPTELYAMHRASASTLEDTMYIYSTAVDKEKLAKTSNVSAMSQLELPSGNYLAITFHMNEILDSLTGYDDIIYTVYTKILPKMNLLRRPGPDIERYTLKESVSYDKLLGQSDHYVQKISYYIPVL
ncbi:MULTISPECIES: AraC family transcriptional regulator [Morganellaceae]|uniref:AraC family transcriptional regulator n=1 Tax=Morganellaceae TaxID=1903414 RepID=UPI000BFE88B6|nr:MULTISPECIES: AraC family transcriptional regulator [Proteus]ATN01062.1 right origin-binding protein [Proteus vulgaris]MBG2839128.1 AraC family transcriptional regulator [Proteus terrae subsp. cibarius]MBG2870321.1 AraC family transcriptional regulator [Proteus terrae subsp. cibarius]MBJ2110339.1 AraC family transcriptional regulator [Proteus terrae]MBJ2134267.1 AraC family transcriptional regulator [Proteus terrae]